MPFQERLFQKIRSVADIILPPEIGRQEITREQYLASLSENDRSSVQFITEAVEAINSAHREKLESNNILFDKKYPPIQYSVIAVGSTVRPENKRSHAPRDIDLRIMVNISQEDVTGKSSDIIRCYIRQTLQQAQLPFEEYHTTSSLRQCPDIGGNVIDWVDYDNSDPSFEVQLGLGLPLHVFISGVDSKDAAQHIKQERRRGGHFSHLV